jgi:hypothetical protein
MAAATHPSNHPSSSPKRLAPQDDGNREVRTVAIDLGRHQTRDHDLAAPFARGLLTILALP